MSKIKTPSLLDFAGVLIEVRASHRINSHAGFLFVRLLILKCCMSAAEIRRETSCRVLTRPSGRRRLSLESQLIVERQRSPQIWSAFHPQVPQSFFIHSHLN